MATRNYLNNRDLLKEIHKSKSSYSYYVDDHAKDFDAIVDNVNSIDKDTIKEARKNRADRLQRQAFAKNEDRKLKLPGKVKFATPTVLPPESAITPLTV